MTKFTRTQRAVAQRALLWAQTTFRHNQSRAMSCRIIEQHFGRGRCATWLKNQLLITTKPSWSIIHHECKEYRLNLDGVENVKKLLNLDKNQLENTLIQQISDRFQTELQSGVFSYVSRGYRQFHGLQTVPKQIRNQVLASWGYRYDYDIVCAAPTLLYQRALRTGMEPLIHIPHYIENRQAIRQQISESYGIDCQAVKQLITGLFQGAYISRWHHSYCYQVLKGNYNHIERLRTDSEIQALRADISVMWQAIVQDMRSIGEFQQRRILGRHKTQIYQQLEQTVMRAVDRYLKKHRIHRFDIHDGFQTTECIDHRELSDYVKYKTGYRVEFERLYLANEKTTTLS